MRHKLFIAISTALLLALAACGGSAVKPPDPPTLVTVTPGPGVLHVVWVQDGLHTTSYVIYRAPRGNPAARKKVKSVPRGLRSYMDTTASDESKVLYSVAAAGPGGTSKATVQIDGAPTGGLVAHPKTCQIKKPSPTDSDGDGVTNKAENTGWKVKIYQGTASIDNVSGTWQQDFITKTVKSNPHKADTDGDGLCDLQEIRNGTDPTAADSDEDGLTDLAELDTWGSDPNNVDTDHDSFNPKITIKGNTETAAISQAKGNPALWDGNEVHPPKPTQPPTSPTLFDTDGDGYSDYNEIIVRQGKTFNPLVANLPEIELSQAGAVNLYVNIGYTDSKKKAQTKQTSLQQGQSKSHTDSSSTTQKWWVSASTTVSAGYSSAKGFSGSVSATVAGGHSHVKTTGWSDTSTQSSQKTYSDAATTASEQGRTIQGGTIAIAMNIHNPTGIAYNLSKLAVTALQRERQSDGSFTFKTITTLSFNKVLNGGITLAPNATKQDLEVSQDLKAGNVILDLMAHPSSLMFVVSNFALSNSAGVNYAFMRETSNARTAFLTIDYGNGDVVRAHVATDAKRKNGSTAGVTLKDALHILGIKYRTAKVTDKNGHTYTVLSQLHDNAKNVWVAVDQTHHKFWTTTVSGGKSGPLTQNFGDITLQPGSDAFLLYVQDQDQDDLFLRDESRLGTSDTKKDTDGDGLSDYFEAKTGWDVKPPQPLPLYPLNPPKHVFSNPTLADADHDGYSDKQEKARDTDPNRPDTDNDGLCDGSGNSTNTSGPCTAGVTPDPKPLVPRFAVLSESPKPYSFTAKPSASTVTVNFSVPVKATSTFSVRSLVRGPIPGTVSFSNGGRTITFTTKNGAAWLPGEVLVVSLDNIAAEATGKKLPVYQYSFRAATNAAGQFSNTPEYYGEPPGYTVVRSIVSGDFNQDGLLDLAFATTNDSPNGGPSTVMVDLQSGGDFSLQSPYTLNGAAADIVTGDFNNDGRLDLAVSMLGNNKVAVLLAGGTVGTFANPVYYSVGKDPGSLAVADFNGDGNLDLVTANVYYKATNDSVLLGNGDGTFKPQTYVPSGPTPVAVAIGDVNGDGIPDIITAYAGSKPDATLGGVSVSLGNGDGTFRQPRGTHPYPAKTELLAIATGDFNGDGWLDVVTVNLDQTHNDFTVLLLLNDAKGDGIFTVQPSTEVSYNSTAVMTADFNGDGRLDIATAAVGVDNKIPATVLYGSGNEAYTFTREDIDITNAPRGSLAAYGLTTVLTGGSTQPLTLVLAGSSSDSPNGELAFFSAPAQ